jgi:hypothetical protein
MSTSPCSPGLDGRKMSKSYGNTIPLWGSSKALREKIYSVVTNSQLPGEPKDPDDSALFLMYQAFASARTPRAKCVRPTPTASPGARPSAGRPVCAKRSACARWRKFAAPAAAAAMAGKEGKAPALRAVQGQRRPPQLQVHGRLTANCC